MKDNLVNDCISRAAALDALADYIHHVDKIISAGQLSADDCMDIAKSVLGEDKLPPAQQGWIPVTERLPEDFTDVLVCLHDIRCGCEDKYYITSAYTERGYWEMTLDTEICDLKVVAWMPLPKPWEGERDGI